MLQAAAGDLTALAPRWSGAGLQPDHQQAQENLGDVLLRLATRASTNGSAQGPAPTTPSVQNKCSARSP